jgi:hypothetical protein
MNNEPVAWMYAVNGIWTAFSDELPPDDAYDEGTLTPLYTHSAKTLTDEEWNKAFDFYCKTDEGVLKFDLKLRDEWKKKQLIRWKEALRKAQEK